jgi:hypothetical protein
MKKCEEAYCLLLLSIIRNPFDVTFRQSSGKSQVQLHQNSILDILGWNLYNNALLSLLLAICILLVLYNMLW